VEREIDTVQEDELEELQPGQQVKSGIKEIIPPRWSERIRQQQDASVPQGPATRSQAKKSGGEDVTSLAVEDFNYDPQTNSDHNSTSESESISSIESAISVTSETEDLAYLLVSDLNQAVPSSTDHALSSPIWKKLMDTEYQALIDHNIRP
jgi:hypothetical protein